LGCTKATADFSKTWRYTVLEMGRYIPTDAIICLRTLYIYFLLQNLHACVPFYVSWIIQSL